jgi:hypothetical protein
MCFSVIIYSSWSRHFVVVSHYNLEFFVFSEKLSFELFVCFQTFHVIYDLSSGALIKISFILVTYIESYKRFCILTVGTFLSLLPSGILVIATTYQL